MRKIIAFLIVAFSLSLAFLSGCAEVVDLRMRLVVHAIGVDIEEGDVLCVSFQTFTGEDIKSDAPIDVNRSNITTFNVYGRTIQEARENLVLQTGKDVIISDTEIIVLGESFFGRDISNILTYFWDDSDVYMGVDIAFANGSAKDIIGRGLDYGVATSELLTKIIYATTMDCTTVSSRAVEVYNYLCERGGACVLPVLTLAKNSESSDDEQSLIYGTVAGVERNLLVVNRVPLAYLTLDETRGINILRGSDQKLALVLDAGGVPVSVNVHLNGTQRKAEIENGHAVITVGILGDVSITDNPFSVPIEEVRELSQTKILELCRQGFEKTAVENGADVLQIGKLLRKYCSDFYLESGDNYENIVKNTEYRVSCNLRMYEKEKNTTIPLEIKD